MNWEQDKAFESKMRVKTIMNDMNNRPTEKGYFFSFDQ